MSLKILHFLYDNINNPWVGGGGAVRVFEIYKRLSQRGHNITVVSGKYPNAKDYRVNNRFEYKFLGYSKNYIISTFSYALEAMKFLKGNARNYDLIIEDFAPWNPIFSYRFEKQRPVVLQIQNYMGKEILKKYNVVGLSFYFIENFYPKRFKNVIVVSQSLNNKLGIKGNVITNGIEKVDNDTNTDSYTAFLGRIDINQKGLDIFLKAIKNLHNVEFWIAGDGKDREKFLKMLENFSNTRYIGKVNGEKKYNFIRNAKFFVMPSRYEGQGIVALEAAALGKPLIVSDIPELKYVVDNGFGISFKNGNADDLAEKIEFLWNNPDLIAKMGKKGREYAKNFTWDKVAGAYEKYLLCLVSNS